MCSVDDSVANMLQDCFSKRYEEDTIILCNSCFMIGETPHEMNFQDLIDSGNSFSIFFKIY